ncbi:Serine/threonine-protein kinase 38 [Goodea atripinnis]|uniref:Serine/threonine-protein kinase 38 n=1 Tax=Goodea atripinnis TaxID=208336 RepID=A0ABV0PSH4_9TELE
MTRAGEHVEAMNFKTGKLAKTDVSRQSMAMTGQSSCASMSNHTKERVTMAKVTLENFYSNLIAQHEEREMR